MKLHQGVAQQAVGLLVVANQSRTVRVPGSEGAHGSGSGR